MMKSTEIKKVVLIGPESSGKSTLCEKLAIHYDVPFVKEYARTYLGHSGSAYLHEDLLHITKGQLLEEKKALERIHLNSFSKILRETKAFGPAIQRCTNPVLGHLVPVLGHLVRACMDVH